MKEGIYKLQESARTYFYKDMTVRIEGAREVSRVNVGTQEEPLWIDYVYSTANHGVQLCPGWTGVTQEGDESPPTQILVEE